MPISRALLNRLRLPYKALEIQGSKGDVLYIPDDVGVDLSVMHGVHNGDMVPVKTDSDGLVSVAIDNVFGATSTKEQVLPTRTFNVRDNQQAYVIDTSKYLNYMFRMIVETSTDHTATISVILWRMWNTVGLESLMDFTINATPGVIHNSFMLVSDNTVSTTSMFLTTQLDIVGKQASILMDYMGYN